MKVIASSLRKGNIVDIDGKLYVVLTAENFHPGKGTPTTQVDMRRISDGVKTSQIRSRSAGKSGIMMLLTWRVALPEPRTPTWYPPTPGR